MLIYFQIFDLHTRLSLILTGFKLSKNITHEIFTKNNFLNPQLVITTNLISLSNIDFKTTLVF